MTLGDFKSSSGFLIVLYIVGFEGKIVDTKEANMDVIQRLQFSFGTSSSSLL